MAITKLPSGKYQVKVKGTNGKWATKALRSMREAQVYESKLKEKKYTGELLVGAGDVTFDALFAKWFETVEHQASPGWRESQRKRYLKHIYPTLGGMKLSTIGPLHISGILGTMVLKNLSEQTQLHVYNLLRKCFSDATELFHISHRNPVKKSFKPRVPKKESKYLQLVDTVLLLQHVVGKPYQTAIWLGLYMGLRVGEVQALRWEDVDLERGIIYVRRTYVRLEGVMREYPKGRRQHSHLMPQELTQLLKETKVTSSSQLVAAPPNYQVMDYSRFRKALKSYCKELGITSISTHGLRHSSTEVWMDAGASRDDLRILLDHKDSSTTDRYVHDHGSRLQKVAKVIKLFPEKVSIEVPRESTGKKKEEVSN